VIPALNRDGDCLSDLVLALFGSIAGAESVLLSLDDELRPLVVMAEHRTELRRHSWEERRESDAMLLACAAVLDHAADGEGTSALVKAALAIRDSTLKVAEAGIRTSILVAPLNLRGRGCGLEHLAHRSH